MQRKLEENRESGSDGDKKKERTCALDIMFVETHNNIAY